MSRPLAIFLASLFCAGHVYAQGLAPLSGPNLSNLPPSAPEAKPTGAVAVPATPMQPATPATPATPADQVWVNTAAKIYYCPGSPYYGRTAAGDYMREATARAMGAQAAQGRGCGR